MAASTTLYYIDFFSDSLVTTSDPNGGVLNTVGSLGIGDFDANAGFDIFSESGGNTAFAALRVGGVTSLYSVDLGTGAASMLGAIGAGSGFFYGLAVAPGSSTVVPEPGSMALWAAAGIAALAMRRRPPASQKKAA